MKEGAYRDLADGSRYGAWGAYSTGEARLSAYSPAAAPGM